MFVADLFVNVDVRENKLIIAYFQCIMFLKAYIRIYDGTGEVQFDTVSLDERVTLKPDRKKKKEITSRRVKFVLKASKASGSSKTAFTHDAFTLYWDFKNVIIPSARIRGAFYRNDSNQCMYLIVLTLSEQTVIHLAVLPAGVPCL